jgi:omega-6 fatty acid desaturase (delta-12 desaturase)
VLGARFSGVPLRAPLERAAGRQTPSAAAVETASIQMTDDERAALAEKLGYRKIGKELPDSVTLQDIIKSLPQEVRVGASLGVRSARPAKRFTVTRARCAAQVFEINPARAWSAVFITLASAAASLYLISVSPWYLLPFAWALAGTAFTGVSSSFSTRRPAAA